jgi:hypothetical protein
MRKNNPGHPTTRIFGTHFNSIYTRVSLFLILPGAFFSIVIFLGFLQVGHLPVSGDQEIVSVRGLDRSIVYFAFLSYLLIGTGWIFLTIFNFILKLNAVSSRSLFIGLFAVGLTYIIIRSPQFLWILD